MSLDLARVEKIKVGNSKMIGRCPACAEEGRDHGGAHLVIMDNGRFGCIANQGPMGQIHRERIWELVGFRTGPICRPFPRPQRPLPYLGMRTARLPDLRPLTVGEMTHLAALRGWPAFAGLELLTRRGLLWFGQVWDDDRTWPSWVITDRSRRAAQARRLDGLGWQGIRGAKAKTIPGSEASWPIGAADIGNRNQVSLCEGQPDFCASLLLAWYEGVDTKTIAPVCMAGAGNNIHPEALPLFAEKRICIAVHADQAGRDAGIRWMKQLKNAGASEVGWLDFDGLVRRDGLPVKDLADLGTMLDRDDVPWVNAFAGFAGNENISAEAEPSDQFGF